MKIVISLGGSVIIPNKVDLDYLNKFKKTILKLKKEHEIIIVTGGGSTARTYINALKKDDIDSKTIAYIGIFTTKLNAKLVAAILNLQHIPSTEKELKQMAQKEKLIVTGALGFHPNMTSDGTAAEAAMHLKADLLINITNVPGLFNKDPNKFKNAKQIPKISFKEFYKITKKIKFKAGQHFVLDQSAAGIIYKARIPTAIVTKDIKNLENLIQGRNFKGTLIN